MFARSIVLLVILAVTFPAVARERDRHALEVAEAHRVLDRAVLSQLRASSPDLVARAELVIGRTKRLAGIAPLISRLQASDTRVREMAAYGLGLIDAPVPLPELRTMARRDRASAVRYAAIDAIGRIAFAHHNAATTSTGRELESVLARDDDPVVRAHAAASFEAWRDAPLRDEIATSLAACVRNDRDDDVRWHCMWAIYRSFARRVDLSFLESALHDRNEVVRVEAARAFGRRRDARASQIVRTAFDDRSWRVQLEAREAFRRMMGAKPIEHLTNLPAGIHLPPIDPPPIRSVLRNAHRARRGEFTAPDPATVPLDERAFPQTASALNVPIGDHPHVRIVTTKGTVTLVLYPEWAPITVANFLMLARRHYFDGNRWFRIVPDFVVQTGDPTDTGDGDAGYAIPAEENPIEQRTGVISMGLNYKDGQPLRDSAGTQFYITLSPQLHLDRDFTVFGEVTSGFDILAHLIESDRIITVTQRS